MSSINQPSIDEARLIRELVLYSFDSERQVSADPFALGGYMQRDCVEQRKWTFDTTYK